MSNQSLFEKLELKDEKNILIQGVPSGIEKQFSKLSYSKNVTPLVKSKKLDFALLFAIHQTQLNNILKEVLPALHDNTKLWVAYPKQTSKIMSDLTRETHWECLTNQDFVFVNMVNLDHMWNAVRFKKISSTDIDSSAGSSVSTPDSLTALDAETAISQEATSAPQPEELERLFRKNKKAKEVFGALSSSCQQEYLKWIQDAKKSETRMRRSEEVIQKLITAKK